MKLLLLKEIADLNGIDLVRVQTIHFIYLSIYPIFLTAHLTKSNSGRHPTICKQNASLSTYSSYKIHYIEEGIKGIIRPHTFPCQWASKDMYSLWRLFGAILHTQWVAIIAKADRTSTFFNALGKRSHPIYSFTLFMCQKVHDVLPEEKSSLS